MYTVYKYWYLPVYLKSIILIFEWSEKLFAFKLANVAIKLEINFGKQFLMNMGELLFFFLLIFQNTLPCFRLVLSKECCTIYRENFTPLPPNPITKKYIFLERAGVPSLIWKKNVHLP